MKDEIGVDLDDVDWRRYDPRQYHPRRIVQNALSDAFDDEDGPARSGSTVAGGVKPGAATSAAKRAQAARSAPAGTAATRPGGTVGAARPAGSTRPGGSSRPATAGPGSASRDSVRGSGATTPLRPSPAPTSWAEAARRAGVDDDAT